MDTEAISQIFIPHKESVEAKKVIHERTEYNNWVWEKVLNVGSLKKRLAGFSFHHEISTDGIAVSVLYSRPARQVKESKEKRRKSAEEENVPCSSQIGVDPGRKNIITAVDQDGRKLQYTSKQRIFLRVDWLDTGRFWKGRNARLVFLKWRQLSLNIDMTPSTQMNTWRIYWQRAE